MKILYILHSTIMGGATLSFINLIKGVKEKGVVPVIVAPQIEEPFRAIVQELGIKYYEILAPMSIYPFSKGGFRLYSVYGYIKILLKLIRNKRTSYNQLKNIVLKENPDIIHTNTGVVHEGYKVARSVGIPHVWHLREYQDKDFHWYIFPSKVWFKRYLRSSYIISITHDILSSFDIKESMSHRVIYNGVMSEKSICLHWPKEKYFLCASRISPEKGIDQVIKVFCKFHESHKDYTLKILGMGNKSYVESLKQMVFDIGCSDSVEFMGFKNNVADYMKKAHGLIVASRCEGFGRMTAEACFSGCVVIGKNSGGTMEIIQKTGGELFDSDSELLACMEQLSQMNEEEYLGLARHAQEVAVSLYSTEKNILETYSFYNDILKENAKGI